MAVRYVLRVPGAMDVCLELGQKRDEMSFVSLPNVLDAFFT